MGCHAMSWVTRRSQPLTPSLTFPWAITRFLHPCCTFSQAPRTVICDFAFSTQPILREVEDFPRGGNHSKHVPLLTYLAWLQPIYYNPGFVFIHVKLINIFACGENFDQKSIDQQSWIKKPSKIIALSKNALQNCYLRGALWNCSLKNILCIQSKNFSYANYYLLLKFTELNQVSTS